MKSFYKIFNIIAIILISFVIFYLYMQIKTLKYHLDEGKRDDFIIQIIYSIIEDDFEFIKKHTNIDTTSIKQNNIGENFFIFKDTGSSWVDYQICFENGYIIYFETGDKIYEYYGGAIFEIINISEITNKEMQEACIGKQYYIIGNHKIFAF